MVQYAHLNTTVTPNFVDGFYDTDVFDYAAAGTLPPSDLYELTPSDWALRTTGHRWTITDGALVAVPLPTATLNQQAADSALVAQIKLGIRITCTGTPAVSGTYPIDAESIMEIGVYSRDSAASFGMPGGLPTCAYDDLAGVPHSFTPTQMTNTYKAMRDYRYLLQVQHDSIAVSGAAPVWPSSAYTIP